MMLKESSSPVLPSPLLSSPLLLSLFLSLGGERRFLYSFFLLFHFQTKPKIILIFWKRNVETAHELEKWQVSWNILEYSKSWSREFWRPRRWVLSSEIENKTEEQVQTGLWSMSLFKPQRGTGASDAPGGTARGGRGEGPDSNRGSISRCLQSSAVCQQTNGHTTTFLLKFSKS